MSYGMRRAGIEVLAGIDNDPECRMTYERNVAGATFIKYDIARLSASALGRRLGINPNDPTLVLVGCSPCQYWTKIRTDKNKSEKSAFLLKNFQRFIRYFQPGFVVVENVPGMMTNQTESVLPGFVEFLARSGYVWRRWDRECEPLRRSAEPNALLARCNATSGSHHASASRTRRFACGATFYRSRKRLCKDSGRP